MHLHALRLAAASRGHIKSKHASRKPLQANSPTGINGLLMNSRFVPYTIFRSGRVQHPGCRRHYTVKTNPRFGNAIPVL